MTYNSSNYAALGLLARVKQAAPDVTLPTVLSDRVANIDRLKSEADAIDASTAREAAVEDARRGKLAAKTVTALSTLALHKGLLGAAYEAELSALAGTVAHVADDFVANVRREVFDPALAKLREVADTTPADVTVADLVRDGKHAEASALVAASEAAAELRKAHQLRALAFGTAGGASAAIVKYANPDAVVPHGSPESAEAVLANIRAGAEPHLPTPDEVTRYRQDRIAAAEAARTARVKRIR